MACPFAPKKASDLTRQPSIADNAGWNLEDEISDIKDDSLSLSHLNSAIQLLTAPANEDIQEAVKSLVAKYSDRWPGINTLKMETEALSLYPHYDYLSDVQDSLLEMNESATSDILIKLGEELMKTCCTNIIERAFRCLGVDLQEFLASLDGVYDVLKIQEEGFTDTEFVCAGEGELIFTSERPVMAWLLLGSLKALSKILYNIEPEISMEPVEGDLKRYRYLFEFTTEPDIDWEITKSKKEKIINQKSISSVAKDLKMNPTTFCKAFPWHFIMNENLELVQMGIGFIKIYKSSINPGNRLAATFFRFKRPKGLSLKFREIVRRTNTPFLISLRAPPGRPDFCAKGLEIKGQMVFCPESNSLLFIGSPFIDGLEGLTCNGLFISDIPLHDATREVILVGEQARAQDGLKRRMDKLKNSIEEGNAAVSRERKKNVSLLHLIFPAEIAERLWTGVEIEAKTYPEVSILFSDICDFTRICAAATPFMVISMLEQLYKDFDEFCGFFDVYKVETIGDAYCVASGLLPGAGKYDAHKAAWMALSMLDNCPKHKTHEGNHIKMRIGIHTGTVLAGVVGRKMPRYCLFGHNVTIANKFESGSSVGRVNISPTTKDWLIKHPGFNFKMEARDPSLLPKEFSNTSNDTCYFLDGYKHPNVDDKAPLREHIEATMMQINV